MGFWQDFYDANKNGWSIENERANKRNIERGRIAREQEILQLKRREVEALEKLAREKE